MIGGVGLPEAMLLDAADEDVAELGVAQHLGALKDRQRDGHTSGRKRSVNSRMALELHSEPRPQFALDRVDQPGEQGRRGEPLPLGEARRVRQKQVRRGHGKALTRRGQ